MNAQPHGRHLAFPFRIEPDGRTATPRSVEDHIRDEIVQLLLTNPGERPFLPEFGGGVRKLIFEPASDALVGLTNARITQALTRWLGHRLVLERVHTKFRDSELTVEIQYRPAGADDSRVLKFQRKGN